MGKLPQLMTARQFAAYIGKSYDWVKIALKENRIPDAQCLPLGWVIPKTAKVIIKFTDIDLDPRFIFDVEEKAPPEYKDFSLKGNKNGRGAKCVELPGYAKVIRDKKLTQREVQKLTGVHPRTQRQAAAGEPVRVYSAWKLARGLNVTIEDLLRRYR